MNKKRLIIFTTIIFLILILIFGIFYIVPKNSKPKLSKELNICYLIDSNYVKPMLVSLYSMFINGDPETEYNIFVIGDNLKENEKKLIRNIVEYNYSKIEFFEAGKTYNDINPKTSLVPGMTKIVFSKLNIENILPKDIDRILVLDADTLIVSDLTDLYNLPLCNKTIGMRMYKDGIIINARFAGDELWQEIIAKGYKLKEYYNAGIILIDMKKFRKKNYSSKLNNTLMTLKKKYPDNLNEILLFDEQDILNIVLKNDIYPLKKEYNAEVTLFNIDSENIKNVKILHYTCIKPWHYEIDINNYPRTLYRTYQKVLEKEIKEKNLDK